MVKNTRRAYKNIQNFEKIKKKYLQEKKPKLQTTKPGPSFKTKRVRTQHRMKMILLHHHFLMSSLLTEKYSLKNLGLLAEKISRYVVY